MTYVERYAKLGQETTFGAETTAYRAINYPLRVDMRVNEHLVSDEIVASAIDQVSRGVRQREITGTLEKQFINAAMFLYSLGKVTSSAVTGSQYYYEYTIIASTPSFSLEKGLQYPVEVAKYLGTKVNVHRLTLERGEDVTEELTLVSKDITYATGNYSPISIDPSIEAFAFYEGQLKKNGTVIAGVQRAIVEINRNLSARWSSDFSAAKPRTVKEFRPGRCEVTGRILLDEATSEFIKACLNKQSFTLTLTLFKDSWNRAVITIKNVLIPEFPDTVTGREDYELEFPFEAAGSATGLDAMKVAYWLEALPAKQIDGTDFKY